MPDIARPGDYSPADRLAVELANEPDTQEAPDGAKPATPEKPVDPIELWRQELKKVELTEAQADSILDSLLAKGYYEREYMLMRRRLRATFRTRDGSAISRVADVLDMARSNDPRVHNQLMLRQNLASSLVSFQGHRLPDEIEKRLAFIDKQPSGVIDALYGALQRFDQLMWAVTNDGAVQGF